MNCVTQFLKWNQSPLPSVECVQDMFRKCRYVCILIDTNGIIPILAALQRLNDLMIKLCDCEMMQL